MNFPDNLILAVGGFVAGLIDSIAGGGGLITLPMLTEIVGPGAHAIGTNKLNGLMGALIAFLVYLRKHPLNLKRGIGFVAAIGVGSFLGSLCTPYLPQVYFRYILILVCPVVLWVIWNKQIFLAQVKNHPPRPGSVLFGLGCLLGFYDGFFGPGGGTFMLIGLLWGVRLPLFEALLLSKLANTMSAGVSLVSFGVQGYVHWSVGLVSAVAMTTGGFLGARFATHRAEKIVRPVLLLVVVLLLLIQLRALWVAS